MSVLSPNQERAELNKLTVENRKYYQINYGQTTIKHDIIYRQYILVNRYSVLHIISSSAANYSEKSVDTVNPPDIIKV